MEALVVRKLVQKFRSAKKELERWDEVQARLVAQFSNASAILERLEVLSKSNNYGALRNVDGAEELLLGKQTESFVTIHFSMVEALKELQSIVISLDKISQDACRLTKGGSTPKLKVHLRIGLSPSVADCLDGLKSINQMHLSEYNLKSSIVSSLTWNCSSSDILALRQLLVDQPNIPRHEVESIFEKIFAGEDS